MTTVRDVPPTMTNTITPLGGSVLFSHRKRFGIMNGRGGGPRTRIPRFLSALSSDQWCGPDQLYIPADFTDGGD